MLQGSPNFGFDVIVEERGIQSQKPNELYVRIERAIPGGTFMELFARNHNVRSGWISLGEELEHTTSRFVSVAIVNEKGG